MPSPLMEKGSSGLGSTGLTGGYFFCSGTVSASGGWISGAGHSIVSPTYGLGIDNAVQFRLVLPSSGNTNRTFTVSACSHPDLFWAIRGGGGGTFGVLTEGKCSQARSAYLPMAHPVPLYSRLQDPRRRTRLAFHVYRFNNERVRLSILA